MNNITHCFTTGVVAAFFAVLVGQTGWTKQLCDDFVRDCDPFDGDPMAWYMPNWGQGEWTSAPDGEEGMDVRQTGDKPANLCTEESLDVPKLKIGHFKRHIQGI